MCWFSFFCDALSNVPLFCAGSSKRDREALLLLFESTGGRQWSTNARWGSDIDIMLWHGVSVDGMGRVNELDLYENSLSGEFCVSAVLSVDIIPRGTDVSMLATSRSSVGFIGGLFSLCGNANTSWKTHGHIQVGWYGLSAWSSGYFFLFFFHRTWRCL